MTHYHQGKYRPVNREKYLGDHTNIIYRSSWECRFCSWLDKTPDVLQWRSEEIAIPYISPVDGRQHRYFCDFWVKMNTKNGIKEYLIEIKPYAQTQKPLPPKRKTKQYMNKVMTWMINQQKWESAIQYANSKGMEFKLITEKELFGTTK